MGKNHYFDFNVGGRWSIFRNLVNYIKKKEILQSLRTLTCKSEQTLDLRTHQSVVVGPFEEEEERIRTASDVVKVEGEDPARPSQVVET